MVVAGLVTPASFAVGPIALLGGAALIYAIGTVIGGGKAGVRASFSAALGKWRQLLLLFIVLVGSGLAVSLVTVLTPVISALGPGGLGLSGLPLFLTLIVAVAVTLAVAFVVIRLTFTLQALMIEDKPARQALQRSWSLTSGSMLASWAGRSSSRSSSACWACSSRYLPRSWRLWLRLRIVSLSTLAIGARLSRPSSS